MKLELVHFIILALAIFMALFIFNGGVIIIGNSSKTFFFRWNREALRWHIDKIADKYKKTFPKQEQVKDDCKSGCPIENKD